MNILSCASAQLLLSNCIEDAVSPDEAADLQGHLAACEACRTQAATAFRLDRALTQLAAQEHVATLAARIHAALLDATAASIAGSAGDASAALNTVAPAGPPAPAMTGLSSGRVAMAWIAGLAAALMIAGIGLSVWFSNRQVSTELSGPLANLEAVEGSVFVTSADGSKAAAASGQAVWSGQGVRTIGEKSKAVVRYPDGTRLQIWPDTTISQLTAGAIGKKVALLGGLLSAGIVKQPEGRPLVLTTPRTEITASATEFALTSEPDATLVEVDKGALQFTRTADGKFVEVREGFYAVAALVEPELAARPLVHAGTEAAEDRWTLEPPRIERTVRVRTLQECQAALAQPHTAVTLDADIDAPGQVVFAIQADHILIDGNGHTIRNATIAVHSDITPRHHIEVRNLNIEKAEVGIYLRRDLHVHVHHNIITGCLSRGMRFENSCGSHGRFFEVHDNKVQGGRQGCILFKDGCTDGRVYNNICTDGGFRPQMHGNGCLNFDSNMIRVEVYGNRIEGGTYGLALHGENNRGMLGCFIHDNTIVKARQAGIRIGASTFRNVLRNNTVRDCPVGVFYQQANRVHTNLLDGTTFTNCILPVKLEGPTSPAKAGQMTETPASENVDRLVLQGWKGGAPVVKVSGSVTGHTVADAGVWTEGAVVVEGPAKVLWSSFAHVVVLDQGKAVAGAEVVAGDAQATTDANGLARLGPFSAVEITSNGVRRVAQLVRIQATLGSKRAEASFTPDGSAANLSMNLK